MASPYQLSITHVDGFKVNLVPGGQEERNFVAAVEAIISERMALRDPRPEKNLLVALSNAVVARGVGVFRTEAHVKQAIAEALVEVLGPGFLHSDAVMKKAVRDGIEEVFRAAKKDVVP